MPVNWPITGNPKRTWCPAEGNSLLLVVALPPHLRQLNRETYLSLLADRLEWLAENTDMTLGEVESLLLDAGDDLGWRQQRGPQGWRRLVESPLLLQRLGREGVFNSLPVDLKTYRPSLNESRSLRDLLLTSNLQEYVSTLNESRTLE
jgi:hypothetical protein